MSVRLHEDRPHRARTVHYTVTPYHVLVALLVTLLVTPYHVLVALLVTLLEGWLALDLS